MENQLEQLIAAFKNYRADPQKFKDELAKIQKTNLADKVKFFENTDPAELDKTIPSLIFDLDKDNQADYVLSLQKSLRNNEKEYLDYKVGKIGYNGKPYLEESGLEVGKNEDPKAIANDIAKNYRIITVESPDYVRLTQITVDENKPRNEEYKAKYHVKEVADHLYGTFDYNTVDSPNFPAANAERYANSDTHLENGNFALPESVKQGGLNFAKEIIDEAKTRNINLKNTEFGNAALLDGDGKTLTQEELASYILAMSMAKNTTVNESGNKTTFDNKFSYSHDVKFAELNQEIVKAMGRQILGDNFKPELGTKDEKSNAQYNAIITKNKPAFER